MDQKKTVEELIPKEYHKYLSVFKEKESEWMPTWKAWDHRIDLKGTFTPKKSRLIPFSHDEQEKVSNWLDDQLHKGYIYLSKSPMMSLVFFLSKKRWEKMHGTRLLIFKWTYFMKQLPSAIDLAIGG